MNQRKPVAVVDSESKGARIKVLRRFDTEEEASNWIGARRDQAKVLRGGYGIDMPEEMLNPPRAKRR